MPTTRPTTSTVPRMTPLQEPADGVAAGGPGSPYRPEVIRVRAGAGPRDEWVTRGNGG